MPFPLALPVLLFLAAPRAPQQFRSELRVDDLLAGRPVRELERAVIDDRGSWSQVVLLDHVGHNENGALVRDGSLLLAEGDFLPQPVARIRFLGVLEGSGDHAAQNVILDSFVPPRPYARTEAVLYRGTIVLTAGEPADIQGLPSSTLCSYIGPTAANASGTVLSVVRLDTVLDEALLAFEFDASGTPLSRKLLLRSGDVLPDGSFAQSFAHPAVDETGGWLVGVLTQDDRTHLMAGNRILLSTGGPSPLPGRSITGISALYDRNDFGGYAVHVALDLDSTTNAVLLKNGALLYQEGELVPSPSPTEPGRRLRDIGQVRLSNAGNVYWHARTGAASLTRGIFMRDRTPILEAGVSLVEGELVTDFAQGFDNFEISPSGRFWIGRVVLATSGAALVTADFGASRVLPGCTQNPGTLRHTEGLVLAGHTIRLVLDGPVPLGSMATLHLATAPAQPGSPCGLPTPFGEVLLDPARVPFSVVAGLFAGGPVVLDLPIPADPALVDRRFFAQGAFLGPGVRLTNGLSLEIGAP